MQVLSLIKRRIKKKKKILEKMFSHSRISIRPRGARFNPRQVIRSTSFRGQV